ncbi:MAG: hypothetical protein P4L57_10660 [Rhizomicrobium sp.]|nr:hypothetical protein [Rhizomicrobium sp.]
MHWRKPFPPRSLRPSPFAEVVSLLVASFRRPEPAAPMAVKREDAAALPDAVTAD